MATPFLLAERVTREGRRLGVKALTVDAVKDIADSGQGFIIGNCSADGLQRHIPHVCRNALPNRTLVACHSYEFASNLFERPSWNGAQRCALLRENRGAAGVSKAPILVTVIEKLYSLRKLARDRQYLPSLLHLVDPHGISIRTADTGEFCGARAQAISRFRAACLAAGHQVAPMLWTTAPCGAFSRESLCELMGVEAFIYLDGSTLRSASLLKCEADATSDARIEHPLDNSVTAARGS